MAARRPERVRAAQVVLATNLADPTVSRAVDQVRNAVQVLQRRRDFVALQADLAIGTTAIEHGLGREPVAVLVTPTVADETFAWALHVDNPHADRQVLIDVVGVAQPGARIFIT